MWLCYAVLFILQVNMVRPQLTFTEEKYERTINSTTKGEVITIIAFDSGGREITYSTGFWSPESGSSIFSLDRQTGVIQVVSQSDIPPGVYVAKVFADIADSGRSVSVSITVVPVVIPPVFNPNNYEKIIRSDTKGEVFTVYATGPDGRVVTYSLGDQNPPSIWNKLFYVDYQTGVIQVISQSDIPPGVYQAIIVAEIDDGFRSRGFATTNITVVPVVIPPVFNPNNYEKIIRSDTKGEVFTVNATGPDGRVVTYSLGGQDPPSIWNTLFSVDSQTGVIQVISQSDIPPGVYRAIIVAEIDDGFGSKGFATTNITVVPVDLCDPNPCQNGGVCNSSGGVAECTCPGGFSGDICDKEDCSEEEEERPIHPHDNYPHGYRHGRGHRHLKKIVKQIRKETKAVRKVLREIFKKVNKGRHG